jgi:hypothetical protein
MRDDALQAGLLSEGVVDVQRIVVTRNLYESANILSRNGVLDLGPRAEAKSSDCRGAVHEEIHLFTTSRMAAAT